MLFLYFFIIWMACIFATGSVAERKGLSVSLHVFLALIIGPFALVIVLLTTAKSNKTIPQHDDDFEQLKMDVANLRKRVSKIEDSLLQRVSGEKQEVIHDIKEAEQIKQVIKPNVNVQNVNESSYESSSIESRFGRFWLNKIGIIVFTLGVGYLISYSVEYFGLINAYSRIFLGYMLCGGLFFYGSRLEKNWQYRNLGYALLGGAWALVYFTTFAMHHFEVSRIIANQYADLILLLTVTMGMIKHALKYKSEEMVGVGLVIAFMTTTLAGIADYTFYSSLILSGVVLVLAYKMQWIRILILGMIATYGIHYGWIMHLTYDHQLLLKFLSVYLVVYTLGIHFIKIGQKDTVSNRLAAANLSNFVLFFMGSYSIIWENYNSNCFIFVFGLGVIYSLMGFTQRIKNKSPVAYSNLIIGLMAMSISLIFKLKYSSVLFVWLVEIPFLLFASYCFKERIYRYLTYILTIIGSIKFIFSNLLWNTANYLSIFSYSISLIDFLLLVTTISFAVCSAIGLYYKNSDHYHEFDKLWNYIYSIISALSFTYFLNNQIDSSWLAVGLSIEALVLYAAFLLIKLRRLAIFSYVILGIVLSVLFAGESFIGGDYKWLKVGVPTSVFFIIYYYMKFISRKVFEDVEGKIVFSTGIMAYVIVILYHLPWQWISLGLGVAGVLFILFGILLKDSVSRMGGLILLAITLFRLIFVDLSQVNTITKIISFIILGSLFLMISYFYNKYLNQDKENG